LGPKVVKKVLAAIDQTVEEFLHAALHISPQYISVQLKAEKRFIREVPVWTYGG